MSLLAVFQASLAHTYPTPDFLSATPGAGSHEDNRRRVDVVYVHPHRSLLNDLKEREVASRQASINVHSNTGNARGGARGEKHNRISHFLR